MVSRIAIRLTFLLCASVLVRCAEAPPQTTWPATATDGRGPVKEHADDSLSPSSTPAGATPEDSDSSIMGSRLEAGVCSRCHIVSVLEWGISSHVDAGTTCQECHGPSTAHVANERNEIKPDRLPRGEAIADLCSDCHEDGCPETASETNCQTCHHVHALVNPERTELGQDNRLKNLFDVWENFRRALARGDHLVHQKEWQTALSEFEEALKIMPSSHIAQERVQLCKRRLNPQVPGFRAVGEDFDPASGLPRQVVVDSLGGLKMTLVPPGKFDIGSDSFEASRPVHTVRVGAFYLGTFEVTQEQWTRWMGENPSQHQGDKYAGPDQMPVERVSWQDCQKLVAKLNQLVDGGGFRLPTEAEWEYACRAGSTAAPSPSELPEMAWVLESSAYEKPNAEGLLGISGYGPHPVGTRPANAWGFFEMQGNVAEWCSSLSQPYPYGAGDGREALAQPGHRLIRGGSFADAADTVHPAFRHAERPQRRYRWNGVRIARSVPAK